MLFRLVPFVSWNIFVRAKKSDVSELRPAGIFSRHSLINKRCKFATTATNQPFNFRGAQTFFHSLTIHMKKKIIIIQPYIIFFFQERPHASKNKQIYKVYIKASFFHKIHQFYMIILIMKLVWKFYLKKK